MARTILIFGAGPGISLGVARRFGQEGFVVTLVARKEDNLHRQVDALSSEGMECHAMYGDVADPNGVRRVIDEHRRERGIPDVVVYNASAAEVRDVLTLNWSTVRTLNEVNIGGALHVAQTILPEYLDQNRGKLFFTGGGQALSPHPEWTALSIGKAGMRNLVQALAKRVEGSGVHVATVTVCGYVQPSDPRYNPASIAELYWKLYEQPAGDFESELTY